MPIPNEQSAANAAAASVQPEDIPKIMQMLRNTFNSDKTRTIAWRLSQLHALDRVLTDGKDELCRALYQDLGKSAFDSWMQEIALARLEVHDVITHLAEWMEDEVVTTNMFNAPGKSTVQSLPLGVVMVMGAWNYPVLLTLQPVIGAIAGGNCVVIKPPSYAPATSSAISKLVAKYMDPEAIVTIEGNRKVNNALLEQKFDMIFFTGSPYVGKVVAEAAAKHLCPVILELGGKSPCIVDKSADLYVAARRICWGALMNSGQTCVRPDYFLVHTEVAGKFINELVGAIKEFYEGNAKKSEWFGRLINEQAFQRISKYVENGKKYLVYGGDMDAKEKYIEPSVFDFGTDWQAFSAADMMNDEVFGPLFPIIRFNDLDGQVIPFIRARPKPLALYLFTTEDAVSDRVFRLVSSGGAVLNDCVVHLANPNLPFGGVGESGMGKYHGKHTFDAFTHKRALLRKTNFMDAPQRYPPYTSDKQLVMSVGYTPGVGLAYEKFVNTLGDKKNLALMAMGAYIIKGMTSKL